MWQQTFECPLVHSNRNIFSSKIKKSSHVVTKIQIQVLFTFFQQLKTLRPVFTQNDILQITKLIFWFVFRLRLHLITFHLNLAESIFENCQSISHFTNKNNRGPYLGCLKKPQCGQREPVTDCAAELEADLSTVLNLPSESWTLDHMLLCNCVSSHVVMTSGKDKTLVDDFWQNTCSG